MTAQVLRDSTKKDLTPDPNGVTTTFSTPTAYKPGTVSVWVNGIRKIRDWDNGFSEAGSPNVTMTEAPLAGDSLQAQYEPA